MGIIENAKDAIKLVQKIDQMVYKLYDLTPEENAVIEESVKA